MTCTCPTPRIVYISAHCSDLCCVSMGKKEHEGYVPHNLGVGGGDDVEFKYCLGCGFIQGEWPLPLTNAEKVIEKKKTPEPTDPLTKDILRHVRETDEREFHNTFAMLSTSTSFEQTLDVLTTLIENGYNTVSDQLLEWLDEWEHYDELVRRLPSDDEDDYQDNSDF